MPVGRGEMVVITIVYLSFFTLLVTLLFINVRCVIYRQARGLAHEARTGLDPKTIGSLPTSVFKQDQNSRIMECVVCLNNLEDGEMTRFLPNCEHNFHVACIDTWLSTSITCPVCRIAAEPMKVVLEPAAATTETTQPLDNESTEKTAEDSGKVLGSSSRLSSFRKILARDYSSQRIHTGLEDDIERQ